MSHIKRIKNHKIKTNFNITINYKFQIMVYKNYKYLNINDKSLRNSKLSNIILKIYNVMNFSNKYLKRWYIPFSIPNDFYKSYKLI